MEGIPSRASFVRILVEQCRPSELKLGEIPDDCSSYEAVDGTVAIARFGVREADKFKDAT